MKQTENTDEREQQELTRIRISVRNLVEFIFRSGDIDNRIGKGAKRGYAGRQPDAPQNSGTDGN